MLSIFNHSDDEEEVPTFDVAPRTSTSHTLLVSDTPVEGEESSPPQQNGQGLKRSLSLPLNWVALLLRSWMM
jgi:hypothetical protein